MNTSEKIRMLRTQKGLSQEELGNLVGLKKAAINKYETGRVVNIKKSMLQKLAEALDVLPADLLDDTEMEFVPNSELDGLDQDHRDLLQDYDSLSESDQETIRVIIAQLKRKK